MQDTKQDTNEADAVDEPGHARGPVEAPQGDDAEAAAKSSSGSRDGSTGSLRRKAGRPQGIMLYGLKAARVEAEMFAYDLSERSGVHKNTIYRLENGITGANPITIRKLCRALGVEPRTLRQPPEKSPY